MLLRFHPSEQANSMVVIDTTITNSTLGSTEWTWDIFYTFSDVYLALVISVGVSLNSMAMSLLIRFNKVTIKL